MAHTSGVAPGSSRTGEGLKLWHFALLGICSLLLAHLGPLARPASPWYPLWALLAALAGRGRGAIDAAGHGAAHLATASGCFLVPGALSGQITQSLTALAWLTALAAASGAVAATIGSLANTPFRVAAAHAAANAAFLATPALWWNRQPFPVALVLACAATALLQAGRPPHRRLLAAALTGPFTAIAVLLVLTAPSLLTRLPVI
ncbi:hypothetical protein ACFVTF_05365 [Kitasatospora sp. NPDC057940]|uniref:hypothetical protein n=1 Tax=Kitasatospora sp. NPDC057940 TaxID=3346285 RepID=UPI0036DC745A